MGGEAGAPSGPDLRKGVPIGDFAPGGMVAGHVDGHPVLMARVGDELLAIGSQCTHYGGPLAEGLVVGDTVRCPWHHACFSLRTGEALTAPALSSVWRYTVERRGDQAFVTEAFRPEEPRAAKLPGAPESVLIVGGGPAAEAAAEMLRRKGYDGPVTLVSDDDAPPVDRPNLSKDYLAGNAPEEWIPLRPADFYAQHRIELKLGRRVTEIDVARREVRLDDGASLRWGALLLATGAAPARFPEAVDPQGRARYLRTLADSRAIIAAAAQAKTAVVLGASFIGLEVAASLRARGLEVHVAAPETRPLERVLGAELGDWVRGLHVKKGVVFHLGRTAKVIENDAVVLDDGTRLQADLVVAGIGVRPREEIAARAGITTNKGIVVDAQLRTSAPGVFAAGDVARYPDPRTGESIRVEHWVVAQRMGQTAARNILGAGETFTAVPFFWSRHYDHASVDYVGHAEKWDRIEIDGDVQGGNCEVRYCMGDDVLAVATVGRERASLEAERAMEEETRGAIAGSR